MHRRAPRRALLLLLTCLLPAVGLAADWEAELFVQRLTPVLEDTPPPAVADIVPGYARPAERAAGLVVADLENAAGTDGDWGKTIGKILRWDLAYAWRPALTGSDFHTYYADAFTLDVPRADAGRGAAGAARVAGRLGITNTLAGRVAVSGDNVELELTLRQLPGDTSIESYRFSGPLDQLSAFLDGLPARLYAALKQAPPQARPSRAALLNPAQWRQLVAGLSLAPDAPRAERTARVRQMWSAGLQTPLSAAHYLEYIDAKSPQEYLNQLDTVRALFPDDAGVETAVARLMPWRDGLIKTKSERLAKAVLDRPQDPLPMLVLADALTDSGNGLAGVALAREAVQRWPDNYRAWWTLGYALINYAWELRGTNTWDQVPETAQRAFPALKDAAGRAIDKALALNRDSSGVWVMKMMTIGGYSEAFMDAYRTAIRLDPDNRRAYEMAINYNLPQWGGSYESVNQIWEAAQEHIHDQAWLDRIRGQYLQDQPATYRLWGLGKKFFPGALALISLVAVLLGVLVWRLRPERGE